MYNMFIFWNFTKKKGNICHIFLMGDRVYICWFVDNMISMDKLILGKVVDLDKGIKEKIIERCPN